MTNSATGDLIRTRNSKLGPKVVEALKARHFDAWFFEDEGEAVERLFSLIPREDVISWGGAMTVDELGIKELARERGYRVIDRNTAPTPEDRAQLMRQALLCGTFLMSSNAVSEDGHLVNIDGIGNRLAALLYGPRQVIVIAGMNKVVKTLEDAVERARTIAAPINATRFPGMTAPCGATGACGDCKSPDSACSHIVITRLCRPAGRIKVILINRDLGF